MRNRNMLILLLCLICLVLFLGVGCGTKITEVEKENKITIPNINIEAPDGISIEIIDADPIYLEPKNGKNQTIMTVDYIVKNNTDKKLSSVEYDILCIGYSSDGKAIFQKRSSSLFTKVSELAPKTYTEGHFSIGFIDGVEKIDRLDISIK